MKTLLPILAIFTLLACSSKNNNQAINKNLIWIDHAKTILPLEEDSILGEFSDLTNAKCKIDRETLFKSILKGIKIGKLKAFMDYPNQPLTPDQVDHIIVQWDSTNMTEDPENPGTFISAPLKMEVTYYEVPKIQFNDHIELDTTNYVLSRKCDFITILTYKKNEKWELIATKKLFDVKLNE